MTFNREAVRDHLVKYRDLILNEVLAARGLMALLMTGTGRKWTEEELLEIKRHLKRFSKRIPALIVFLSPGGWVLLPLLIEVLDRRKKKQAVERERRKGLI